MIKKRVGPRPSMIAAGKMLRKIGSTLLSALPDVIAVTLFSCMVVLFILVLTDIACLDSRIFVAVTP